MDPQDPGRRDADVPSEGEARVAVHGVGKRFGGVQALRDVSLEIRRGEIHALVGENGAGKSTLGRIISGAVALVWNLATLDSRMGRVEATVDRIAAAMETDR